ncbi:phosphatase PAP2 family protein [Devosia sp. UYZn731]|uniref:phosphatase PAP2 family protein n=1 Tax=Devosia sp. UYZn731 TaxID=3156345 RepID=UPI00339A6754
MALFSILAVTLIYTGPSVKWDVGIAAAVQSMRNPALDAMMITATYLCSWQVVVTGAVLTTLFFFARRMWFAAAAMIISILGNVLIVGGIKSVMHRVRPDQTHALLPASGSTFPSGHTFSAFAFYGLLGLIYVGHGQSTRHPRLVGSLTVALIAAVGTSRIYVGAHWPSDVLGSTFLGSGWLALVGLVLAAIRERMPASSSQTSNRTARRWAVLLVLLWAVFIVVYAFIYSPAAPSAAIA